MALRHSLHHLLEEIALCERGMQGIEKELDTFARRDRRSQLYLQAGGVGLLTATALSASVGDLARFDSGRHLASALGLPPREHSSGNTRRLGRMTKRGDS
ncbi:Transposase IS116/IS110/IS902 family protein [Aquimonas voraii]|uniref:Transposase IS116/IS110/IS902 family protein n=1 Tax=Aquimonas voraii TaxID=265719 RepID=A0A1G7A6H6_9GAMM|nr:Transposase IS116/IS110/IS902 family protein [Aquimonas voraii]